MLVIQNPSPRSLGPTLVGAALTTVQMANMSFDVRATAQ